MKNELLNRNSGNRIFERIGLLQPLRRCVCVATLIVELIF